MTHATFYHCFLMFFVLRLSHLGIWLQIARKAKNSDIPTECLIIHNWITVQKRFLFLV